MRLDVYLKLSRLIKRRSIARDMCDKGRVLVNGQIAKPSKDVRPGHVVTLYLSTRIIELEILGLPMKQQSVNSIRKESYQIRMEKRAVKDEDTWSENLS